MLVHPRRKWTISTERKLQSRTWSDLARRSLCINDMVAIGAMQTLAAAGRKGGRDFPLVGFDDPVEAPLCRPALTTVANLKRATWNE